MVGQSTKQQLQTERDTVRLRSDMEMGDTTCITTNRSAVIRRPHTLTGKARRVGQSCPPPSCMYVHSYLMYVSGWMAGWLDAMLGALRIAASLPGMFIPPFGDALLVQAKKAAQSHRLAHHPGEGGTLHAKMHPCACDTHVTRLHLPWLLTIFFFLFFPFS